MCEHWTVKGASSDNDVCLSVCPYLCLSSVAYVRLAQNLQTDKR